MAERFSDTCNKLAFEVYIDRIKGFICAAK